MTKSVKCFTPVPAEVGGRKIKNVHALQKTYESFESLTDTDKTEIRSALTSLTHAYRLSFEIEYGKGRVLALSDADSMVGELTGLELWNKLFASGGGGGRKKKVLPKERQGVLTMPSSNGRATGEWFDDEIPVAGESITIRNSVRAAMSGIKPRTARSVYLETHEQARSWQTAVSQVAKQGLRGWKCGKDRNWGTTLHSDGSRFKLTIWRSH